MSRSVKLPTAKERTVDMFRGTTFGLEQRNFAAPIVEMSGMRVQRIALALGQRGTVGFVPALHFREPISVRTLCGVSIADTGVEDVTSDLKECQACRAEASRLRATVGR